MQILAKAKTFLLEGKTIMSYGDVGTSVSKVFPMAIDKTIAECNYALRILNPTDYGYERDKRRVHANFNGRFEL